MHKSIPVELVRCTKEMLFFLFDIKLIINDYWILDIQFFFPHFYFFFLLLLISCFRSSITLKFSTYKNKSFLNGIHKMALLSNRILYFTAFFYIKEKKSLHCLAKSSFHYYCIMSIRWVTQKSFLFFFFV